MTRRLSASSKWSFCFVCILPVTRGLVAPPLAVHFRHMRKHKHATLGSMPDRSHAFVESGDEDGIRANETDGSESSAPPDKLKPMSRLAMAAADWMEEEEDHDELLAYWDRFDEAKSKSKNDGDSSSPSNTTPSIEEEYDYDADISTEERLDRYYQSRGIDKSAERKHVEQIDLAVASAVAAASALEAIRALEKVRPYLQVGSKRGGAALLELARAYLANGEEDEAFEICKDLMKSNPPRASDKGEEADG
ncbi:hypothetical protein ACHAWF_000507 [Thalassiosira exigua]